MIVDLIGKNFSTVQIILPFAAGLAILFIRNIKLVQILSAIVALILLLISFFGVFEFSYDIDYVFGGWKAPYGIEHNVNVLNRPLFLLLNSVLSFLCIFATKLIVNSALINVQEKKHHLFFALLFFAHTGYLGMLSTGDLFNLYVFIEISALSTYALVSSSQDPRALVGAFNYLLLGTIGATLILISIGFIFAITGSLNMKDVAKVLSQTEKSSTIVMAMLFFMVGFFVKLAMFPLHLWMVRVYSYTASVTLIYTSASANIISIYSLLKFFTQVTTVYAESYQPIFDTLYYGSLILLLICSSIAYFVVNIKEMLAYSAAAQICYVILLISISAPTNLILTFAALDTINKVSILYLIGILETKTTKLSLYNFARVEEGFWFKLAFAFSIISSASLPISGAFLLKINIFELLLSGQKYFAFVVFIIGGFIAILYHIRYLKAIFLVPHNVYGLKIKNSMAMYLLVILHILPIIFFSYNL